MNKLFFLSLFLLALFIQNVTAGQKCRALALEAGGDLGSFEAGAYKALVYNLPAEEVQYDVYTGISIGSINTLGLSQYPKGQEKDQADWLINLWSGLKQKDVYKNFKGGIVQGLLYERGIFDSSPALELLKKVATKPAQRKINIGTCNLRTGDLVRYNETSSISTLVSAALASGSVPTFFPYSTLDDQIYVDGGTTGILIDLQGAVQRCREIVSDDSDIIVDAIFVKFSKSLDLWTTDKKKKTMEVFQRANTVIAFSNTYRQLLDAMSLYPDVNFRYIIKPSHALPNQKMPFLFSNKQMNEMIEQGYQDTLNIIQSNGSEGNAKQVYQEIVQRFQTETGSNIQNEGNRQEQMLNAYNKIRNSLKM
ncbi:hypothetical protein ABPG74_007818 [Tetrahymena malaccensis]